MQYDCCPCFLQFPNPINVLTTCIFVKFKKLSKQANFLAKGLQNTQYPPLTRETLELKIKLYLVNLRPAKFSSILQNVNESSSH